MTDQSTTPTECEHCARTIHLRGGRWLDLEATGDDALWSETCDRSGSFEAEHEPVR